MMESHWRPCTGRLVVILLFCVVWLLLTSSQALGQISSSSSLSNSEATESTSIVKCSTSQNRPLSHRVYCRNRCQSGRNETKGWTFDRVKSVDEFSKQCDPSSQQQQSDSHLKQSLTETLRLSLSYPWKKKKSSGRSVSVFVLDFRLVSDNIYIDFKSLGSYKPDLGDNKPLIINLVTKQFVTFRLINVPSTNVNIRVLLNGDASVNFLEKKRTANDADNDSADDSFVEIIHAPLYNLQENRTDWVTFIEKTIMPKRKVLVHDYIEYLTMLCHVSHLRLDLPAMLRLANGRETFKNQPFVEPMESQDDLNDYHMIKRCNIQTSRLAEIQAASSSSKKLVNNDETLDGVGDSIWSLGLFGGGANIGGGGGGGGGGGVGYNDVRFIGTRSLPDQTQVYMLMIDQDSNLGDDEDNSLRIFIEGCNIHTEYILILYIKTNINSKSSDSTGSNDNIKKKKIILDDFNCIIKVYSNTQVVDLLNEKFHDVVEIDDVSRLPPLHKTANRNVNSNKVKNPDESDRVNPSSNKTSSSAFKYLGGKSRNSESMAIQFNLAYMLQAFHSLTFDSFYFLKINSEADDLELCFLSGERSTVASNKFFNKLYQQAFVEKSPVNQQYSLKFVIPENDLLELFKHHNLDLGKYVEADEWYNEESIRRRMQQEQHSRIVVAKNGVWREWDNRYFFVSNKKCRVIFLTKQVSYINEYLLLFNSDLYNNSQHTSCFYHETSTETLYTTFGFRLSEQNYTNSIYFNLKQLGERVNQNIKNTQTATNNNMDKIKDKSASGYFKNIVHNTIRLNYTVLTQLLSMSLSSSNIRQARSVSSSSPSLAKHINAELTANIRLTTLDDSIAWRLDSCWLDDNICLNELHTTTYTLGDQTDDHMLHEMGLLKDKDDNDELKVNLNDVSIELRANRTGRRVNRKLNMVQYKLNNFTTRFDSPSPSSSSVKHDEPGLYTFHASFTLAFNDMINTGAKRFILCNLQPYPSCLPDSAVLAGVYSPTSTNPNFSNSCTKTSKVVKYLDNREQTSIDTTKTVAFTMYHENNPNQLESLFVFDSSSKNLRNGCPYVNNINNNNNNNNETNDDELDQTTKSQRVGLGEKISSLAANNMTRSNSTNNDSMMSRTICNWLKENTFTLILFIVFILFLLGFIILVRLMFFQNNNNNNNDFCFKIVLLDSRQTNTDRRTSNTTVVCNNQNGIHAEQQVKLLDKSATTQLPTFTEISAEQKPFVSSKANSLEPTNVVVFKDSPSSFSI